jgi:acyl-CoA thioesterase I
VHAPELLILGLGGNDGLRGYPLDELRKNLATMLEQSRAAGARAVLVGVSLPPNYGPDYRRGFAAVYAALAEEYDVPLVRFAIEDVADRPGMLQDDGVHPTAAAQPWMLDRVWAALEPLLKCTV